MESVLLAMLIVLIPMLPFLIPKMFRFALECIDDAIQHRAISCLSHRSMEMLYQRRAERNTARAIRMQEQADAQAEGDDAIPEGEETTAADQVEVGELQPEATETEPAGVADDGEVLVEQLVHEATVEERQCEPSAPSCD